MVCYNAGYETVYARYQIFSWQRLTIFSRFCSSAKRSSTNLFQTGCLRIQR
jgi:hypothetical protein